jgi:hypothetical protein
MIFWRSSSGYRRFFSRAGRRRGGHGLDRLVTLWIVVAPEGDLSRSHASFLHSISPQNALVSALPFTLNCAVASVYAREGRSYFDFTEASFERTDIGMVALPSLGGDDDVN